MADRNKLLRLDNAVWKMAVRVCEDRGIDVVDYLGDLLRPLVRRDYRMLIRKEDVADPPPSPPEAR